MAMFEHAPPICFYGDDFTGATAHLAGFHEAGLRALLFFNTPNDEILRRHAGLLDVIGVAGISRSLAPEAMRAEVLPALKLFRALGSRQVQYKVCSTFDSAPDVGSIGLAIELGHEIFGARSVPVVVGSPAFGRYTVFGNHFARYGDQIERLDRHPSMVSHPSTPMNEADLRQHLAQQTDLKLALVDILSVRAGKQSLEQAWRRVSAGKPGAVVFDTLYDDDLDAIAELLLEEGAVAPVYCIAAQGLAEGMGRQIARSQSAASREPFAASDVDRMLVLSGSAAQLNAAQIQAALDEGWSAQRIDVVELLAPGGVQRMADALAAKLVQDFNHVQNVLFYTAQGPADPDLHRAQSFIRERHIDPGAVSRAVGELFSLLTLVAVKRCGLRRVVLAGGDTTSHAMRLSDAYALEIVARARSGGRLCRLLSQDGDLDGVEVMLKGGQVGNERTFVEAGSAATWVS